ncbi:MAG: hypothetical protein ACRD3T_03485 [Terriglobia bacterium]
MNKMSSRQTWASIGLGALCVFLVARLVVDTVSVSAKSQSPEIPPRSAQQRRVHTSPKTTRKTEREFPQTPVLRLDLLKLEDGQTMVALDRNPFQFAPTPAQMREARAQKDMAAGGGQPAPPLVAPPVPYKALGYSENEHGQFQAYLTDDKDIFVVHEGDDLGRHYKILKITPNLVEVRDESFNQTSQLLFPQ